MSTCSATCREAMANVFKVQKKAPRNRWRKRHVLAELIAGSAAKSHYSRESPRLLSSVRPVARRDDGSIIGTTVQRAHGEGRESSSLLRPQMRQNGLVTPNVPQSLPYCMRRKGSTQHGWPSLRLTPCAAPTRPLFAKVADGFEFH